MDSVVCKEPAYLFSPEDMPRTPVIDVYGVSEVKWFGSDRQKEYRKNPHPLFGPEDIIYRINSYGYRCPEFELRKQAQEDAVH
ncbi:MAG: hypothetical protein ACREPR_10130, partial [Brasilonema sp.]